MLGHAPFIAFEVLEADEIGLNYSWNTGQLELLLNAPNYAALNGPAVLGYSTPPLETLITVDRVTLEAPRV